jgi:hypothetical protein
MTRYEASLVTYYRGFAVSLKTWFKFLGRCTIGSSSKRKLKWELKLYKACDAWVLQYGYLFIYCEILPQLTIFSTFMNKNALKSNKELL